LRLLSPGLILGRLDILRQILKLLAGLEYDHLARRQPDGFVRPGIAGDTTGSAADLEDAEIPQFYTAVFGQRIDHGVQNALNNLAGHSLVNAVSLRQILHNLFLRHNITPTCHAGRRCSTTSSRGSTKDWAANHQALNNIALYSHALYRGRQAARTAPARHTDEPDQGQGHTQNIEPIRAFP